LLVSQIFFTLKTVFDNQMAATGLKATDGIFILVEQNGTNRNPKKV